MKFLVTALSLIVKIDCKLISFLFIILIQKSIKILMLLFIHIFPLIDSLLIQNVLSLNPKMLL
jgi:hypothetical protein